MLNSKKARTVSVPKEYFCNDLQLIYPTDLIKLLRIINHWDVDELPDEVYEYLNKVVNDDLQKRELSELLNEVKFLKFTKEIQFFLDFDKSKFELNSNQPIQQLLDQLELLNYIKGEGYSKISDFFNNHFNIANKTGMSSFAESGCLESIKHLVDYGCKLTHGDFKIILSKGHVDCMSYYLDDEEFRKSMYRYERGLFFAEIFEHGHFDCLKYLCESGAKFGYTKNLDFINKVTSMNNIYTLAEKGHFNCLKYFAVLFWRLSWSTKNGQQILMRACRFGHLEIVKYCIANKCLYAGNNSETNYDGCTTPLLVAVKYNHFEIVKLLWSAYPNSNSSFNRNLSNIYLGYAFDHGNLEMIKLLRKNGFAFPDKPYRKAVKSNNIEIVKYLHENKVNKDTNPYSGNSIDNSLMSIAAKNGNFEMIKYLIELGFPHYCDTVFRNAISIDRVDILDFFVKKHKITRTERYTQCAVYSNAFECLKYLHENNFKLGRECVDQAIKLGKFKILKYLLDNDCPYVTEIDPEVKSNYINMYKLLIEHLEK